MPIKDKEKRNQYYRDRRKKDKELIKTAKLSLGIPLDARKKLKLELKLEKS